MAEEIKKLQEQMEQVLKYTLLKAKNVLNFEDLALLTGLSKGYLYKMTCTHQIPYYKPSGKLIFFDREEVEEWMKRNRQNTMLEAEQKASAYAVASRKKGGAL